MFICYIILILTKTTNHYNLHLKETRIRKKEKKNKKKSHILRIPEWPKKRAKSTHHPERNSRVQRQSLYLHDYHNTTLAFSGRSKNVK